MYEIQCMCVCVCVKDGTVAIVYEIQCMCVCESWNCSYCVRNTVHVCV